PEQATEFVSSLLSEWIDDSKRNEIMKSFKAEADGEGVSAATFPFTKDALSVFVEYACRNGNVTNPRDIQKALDDKLNRAIDDDRHVLSASYIHSLIAAG